MNGEHSELRALGLVWRLEFNEAHYGMLTISRDDEGEEVELHRWDLASDGLWPVGKLYSWIGGFLLRNGLDFFHQGRS